MYLVVLKWTTGNRDTVCVVTKTKLKAEEYIKHQTEGYMPSGLGYYEIIKVEMYD